MDLDGVCFTSGLPQIPDANKGAGLARPWHRALRAAPELFQKKEPTRAAKNSDQRTGGLHCCLDLGWLRWTLHFGVPHVLGFFGNLAVQSGRNWCCKRVLDEYRYIDGIGDCFEVRARFCRRNR